MICLCGLALDISIITLAYVLAVYSKFDIFTVETEKLVICMSSYLYIPSNHNYASYSVAL